MFPVKYEIRGLRVWLDDETEEGQDLGEAGLRYCWGQDPKVWALEYEDPDRGFISITLPAGAPYEMLDFEYEQEEEEYPELYAIPTDGPPDFEDFDYDPGDDVFDYFHPDTEEFPLVTYSVDSSTGGITFEVSCGCEGKGRCDCEDCDPDCKSCPSCGDDCEVCLY